MGFILDTLGYAAQRGADIAEQNRIAKRKQEESFSLLDYQYDKDLKLFDVKQTRAEKQLANKAKRDQDKELNDKIKEASLYFKPDKMSVITSGGILGLNLAIEQAKNYVANGYDPNTMMDISDLNVDPKDLDLNTFSGRFKRVPKTDSKTASTYEGEYIRLNNLALREQDPQKKEQYNNQAKKILALTKDPESDGQFLSSKQSINTLIQDTTTSLFENYNQVERNESGVIIGRLRDGNAANAAYLFNMAADLLTKKHDRDNTMPKQQGWIDRSNTQFWVGVESLRTQATQIRTEHLNTVIDKFKRQTYLPDKPTQMDIDAYNTGINNARLGQGGMSFRLPSSAKKATDYYANKEALLRDKNRFKENDIVPFYQQLDDGTQVVEYYLFSSVGPPTLLGFKE